MEEPVIKNLVPRTAAPMLFATILNRVNRDGGYTGWTPWEYVARMGERTITAGLQSGYTLLHVVSTVDRGLSWDEPLDMWTFVERTVELTCSDPRSNLARGSGVRDIA